MTFIIELPPKETALKAQAGGFSVSGVRIGAAAVRYSIPALVTKRRQGCRIPRTLSVSNPE